jgi:hypothetical protein
MKTYILMGFKYRIRRPATYSLVRKPGRKSRSFNVVKDLGIEMRDIRKEMPDQMPDALLRLHILLPASRTIPLLHGSAAVQTIPSPGADDGSLTRVFF